MKPRAWWQNGLVYLGYTAFFVFAFISCIYLTLPLDALQGYLVRKLSDEHGMDLTVERLSTWRLTGFEAENVVIRPRPSPEELAAITAAREARKAWDEQHKGKGDRGDKAEKSDAGATPGEPAAALGKAPTDAPKAGAPEPPTVPAGPAPIEAARLLQHGIEQHRAPQGDAHAEQRPPRRQRATTATAAEIRFNETADWREDYLTLLGRLS
jgi:hypothetical protein